MSLLTRRVCVYVCVSLGQSAHLALSTTPPEAMAASLKWYLSPLARLGLPVDEVVLTTLLSLRFMALVFEEVGCGLPFSRHPRPIAGPLSHLALRHHAVNGKCKPAQSLS
jgi:hypothetical protein